MIAVTPEGRLLLTEQLRLPVGRRVIELPAGLVGDDAAPGESVEAAARRELLEETGYEPGRIIPLAYGPPSAGLSSELVWLVRAADLVKRGAGGGDPTEAITVHEVPTAELIPWLRRQEAASLLVDLKVYAALPFVSAAA
jgi:ADP-ribose pyrophosphatase